MGHSRCFRDAAAKSGLPPTLDHPLSRMMTTACEARREEAPSCLAEFLVARMERSAIRGPRQNRPGFRFAPSGLRVTTSN
jgi:hypothetical protein